MSHQLSRENLLILTVASVGIAASGCTSKVKFVREGSRDAVSSSAAADLQLLFARFFLRADWDPQLFD